MDAPLSDAGAVLFLLGVLLLFGVVGIVVVAAHDLFSRYSDLPTGLGWLTLAGVCVAVAVALFHATGDVNRRVHTESHLLSAEMTIRACVPALAEVAGIREAQQDDRNPDDGSRPHSGTVNLSWQQADATRCVFEALEILASHLGCRVWHVGLPSTISETLGKERHRWQVATDHYAVQSVRQQPTSGHVIANVQVPSDDLVWPVLSGSRADAWVYWPDGGDQITVRLPTEPRFHQYCLDLATVPRSASEQS